MFRSVSLFKVQTFTVYILNMGEFNGAKKGGFPLKNISINVEYLEIKRKLF